MINNIKKYFVNSCNKENNLKLYKKGIKFYVSCDSDIYIKKNYKSCRHTLGYDYSIKSYNFNVLCAIFKFIYKKNMEYSKVIKYINLFNNKYLFIKKN